MPVLSGVRGDAMNFLRGFRHSDSQNSYPSSTCGQKRTMLSDATQFYRRFFPILVCCMLLGAPSLSFGQSTFGSVRGVVQDASGAVVSDTEIVLHSTDENTERTVNADASGNFILENVKAGKYSLHAHHNGFADTVISGISVEARQDLRLTVALKIAEQSTTVQVTSGVDQINTENATLDDSKSNIEMTQLPLNNRATTTSPLGG